MPNKQNNKAGKKPKQPQATPSAMTMHPIPVPPCTHVQLIYPFNYETTASGTEVNHVFIANSCFDPDSTGVGSQPAYYDQWMALYGRYRVVKAYVEARVTAASSSHVACTMAPSNVSGSSYIYDDVAAWRNSVNAFYAQGGPPATLRIEVKPNSVWGVSKAAMLAEDDFRAGASATPNRAAYVTIACKTHGISDVVSVVGRIVMSVRFESPSVQTLSATRRITPRVTPSTGSGTPATSTSGGEGPERPMDSNKEPAVEGPSPVVGCCSGCVHPK
jgi:hypothetical protein